MWSSATTQRSYSDHDARTSPCGAHEDAHGPAGPLGERVWPSKPGVSITQVNASLQPLTDSVLEMEVKEAAFNHASAYDREQFLKCWMDVLPGSQGRSYTRRKLSTPLWVMLATTAMVLPLWP